MRAAAKPCKSSVENPTSIPVSLRGGSEAGPESPGFGFGPTLYRAAATASDCARFESGAP
jgi:hypothetical protein